MPKTSCIAEPTNQPLIVLKQWQLDITGQDHCAAGLISFYQYWHEIKMDNLEQNKKYNQVKERHGETPDIELGLLQFHTQEDLEKGLLGLFGITKIKESNKKLEKLGFISIHKNPSDRYKFDNTNYFLFHPKNVQNAISSLNFPLVKNDQSLAENDQPSVKSDQPVVKNDQTRTETTTETTTETNTTTTTQPTPDDQKSKFTTLKNEFENHPMFELTLARVSKLPKEIIDEEIGVAIWKYIKGNKQTGIFNYVRTCLLAININDQIASQKLETEKEISTKRTQNYDKRTNSTPQNQTQFKTKAGNLSDEQLHAKWGNFYTEAPESVMLAPDPVPAGLKI